MNLLIPILAFTAAAGLLTVTPGLDTAMVLRAATRGGPRDGASAAVGICLGCLVWGVGAALGLTALLAASELAFTALKWSGAAYLLWLGFKLLFASRQALAADAETPAAREPDGAFAAFRRGLLTNLMNPKVGVFYITFLPQFIPQGVNVTAFSVLLASIHALLGLSWFSLLIALTVPLGRLLARPPVVRWLDRLTGLVFVGFALKLALSERR